MYLVFYCRFICVTLFFLQASCSNAKLVGACFGAQSCIGLGVHNMFEESKKWDCPIVNHTLPDGRHVTKTSSLSSAVVRAGCVNSNSILSDGRPLDGLPVTFNFPVLEHTLQFTDFLIETSSGEKVNPECVLLGPANEPNEGYTVALLGHFGGREIGTYPKSIRVTGQLTLLDPSNSPPREVEAMGTIMSVTDGLRPWPYEISRDQLRKVAKSGKGKDLALPFRSAYGEGLEFTSGVIILQAMMYPFSKIGESTFPDCIRPTHMFNCENHCAVDFPSTTHIIRVVLNGGITYDGVHNILPDDKELFDVVLADGESILAEKYLGLADLGFSSEWRDKRYRDSYISDGDNIVDICLRLDDEDIGVSRTHGDNTESNEYLISYVFFAGEKVTPPSGPIHNRWNKDMYFPITHNPAGHPYAFKYESVPIHNIKALFFMALPYIGVLVWSCCLLFRCFYLPKKKKYATLVVR